MDYELLLKVILTGIVIICIALLFSNLLSGSFWFNHKRLSIVAKHFYNYYYSIEKINHLRINNFGYAPLDEEIKNFEPDLQYGIQLYKELVKKDNSFLIRENSLMAEIGCGKGAGAEFIINKFKPKKYIGIDYSTKAIDYCNKTYENFNNAEFICGDAHQLPIASNSIEVVLNIESSHIYRNLRQFFKEVNRILIPGGKFLLTDFRYIKNIPLQMLENEIVNAGFSIVEKKIITPQIFKACILASERRAAIIMEASPWYLKKFFFHYAIVKGTKKFTKLGNGEIVYFLYHLKKNE